MKIIPIRALKDNYIWAVINCESQQAIIVDPGEASPVIAALENLKIRLSGILITHHHWDHTNGIAELLEYAGDIPVIASHLSSLNTVTQFINNNDDIRLIGTSFRAIAIPGHTLDHTAYYSSQLASVFTGDTLFSAGCGRIFEGDPIMMFNSLAKLAALNDSVNIYCGHEYTAANLRFAETVEPNNPDIKMKLQSLGHCTLPSTLGEEKKYNPFLRSHIATVREAAEQYAGKTLETSQAVFAVLREWKNNYPS